VDKQVIHLPVMGDEVIHWLVVKNDGFYLDATLGSGGHSELILKRTNAYVIGIDLDREQIKLAEERLSCYKDRFMPINANFKFIDSFIGRPVDGVLFDLGYSTYQLNTPQKGFSYRMEGPLDMRYGRQGMTAYDIIEEWEAEEIADMLYRYGGERKSRNIARKIKDKKPKTTGELALLVRKSVPRRNGHKHLGRVFQAFRIAVNREMENIKQGIIGAFHVLNKNGHLVVITYHSGEEKLVLKTVNELGYTTLTTKPITPGKLEFNRNPRCRSAHLRVFEK